MRTIILPGYSSRNREWADELAAAIPGAEVHPWPHWEAGGTLDAVKELAAVKRRITHDVVNLLAKSVGCQMAVRIVGELPVQIHKLVLCGLPGVQVLRRPEFAAALSRLPAGRILVVQNCKDPHATFAEVRDALLASHPGVRVVEGDRSDHHYPYPEIFSQFLDK